MAVRQVLGFVGAAVGSFFGMPQIGFAIGSAIGNAIDPQVIKGPAIGDLAQQTSQEGTPRPIVFALSPPMAGNIIASGPARIVKKKKSAGKGGPKVETQTVFRTYAVGVCEGPISSFVRIWRNGELVFDASDSLNFHDGTGSVEDQIKAALRLALNNQAWEKKARYFVGTFDQNASPDLEAVFGVGTTPAHRGTAYMVIKDDDLTDLRGAIPQYSFQVARCEALQPFFVAGRNSDGATHSYMTSPDGINWTLQTNPAMVPVRQICFSPALTLFVAVGYSATEGRVQTSPDGVTWTTQVIPADFRWNDVCWSPQLGLFVAVGLTGGTSSVMTSPDGINWTLRVTPDLAFRCCAWLASAGLFAAVGDYVSVDPSIIITSPDGINWTLRDAAMIGGHPFGAGRMTVGPDFFIASTRGELRLMKSNDGITWGLVPSVNVYSGQGNVGVGGGTIVAPIPGGPTTRNLYSLDDGATFNETAALNNGSEAVAYSPELERWVVTGSNATNGQNASYSPDGIIWTNGSTPLLGVGNEWDCVCYGLLPQGVGE